MQAAAGEIARVTNRKIVAIPADLRSDAEAKNFIDEEHKALGRIDIMVNNAGSAAWWCDRAFDRGRLGERDFSSSSWVTVRCLRYALPIMVKQGGGRVVNLIGNDA